MPDSLALPAIAAVCAALVALAMVWPQGQGARSPAPFGHAVAPIVAAGPIAATPPLALRGPLEPLARKAAQLQAHSAPH
jgi:hypothetical protein